MTTVGSILPPAQHSALYSADKVLLASEWYEPYALTPGTWTRVAKFAENCSDPHEQTLLLSRLSDYGDFYNDLRSSRLVVAPIQKSMFKVARARLQQSQKITRNPFQKEVYAALENLVAIGARAKEVQPASQEVVAKIKQGAFKKNGQPLGTEQAEIYATAITIAKSSIIAYVDKTKEHHETLRQFATSEGVDKNLFTFYDPYREQREASIRMNAHRKKKHA